MSTVYIIYSTNDLIVSCLVLNTVLAHAFYPNDGRIHFNKNVFFTEDSKLGFNLRIVATHEIGHVIGLRHSNFSGALMFANYQGYVSEFKLSADDIDRSISLYGPRHEYSKNVSVPCSINMTMDAVFLSHNRNDLLVLVNDHDLWLFDVESKKWRQRCHPSDLYPNLPSGMRGGLVYREKTFFIKENQLYSYYKNKLSRNYPKQIRDPSMPASVDALFELADRRTYIASKNELYEFDLKNRRIIGEKKDLITLFQGVPIDFKMSGVINFNPYFYVFDDNG